MYSHEAERRQYLTYLHREADHESGKQHEIATSPLFSLAAKYAVEGDQGSSSSSNSSEDGSGSDQAHDHNILPQYGLLGHDIGEFACEPVLLNTHAPNSFFVCGSQGESRLLFAPAKYWLTWNLKSQEAGRVTQWPP